ncbi:MAG: hypothetical protein C4293_18815 [Nitrospiraceae bacterium]
MARGIGLSIPLLMAVLVMCPGLQITMTPAAYSADTPASESLDLNTATEEQLMKLPDINLGLALQIMGGRPYQSSEELVSRQILTREAYDKIKDRITAKAPKKK